MTDLLVDAARARSPIELTTLMEPAAADAVRDAVLAEGPYELYAAERSRGPLESKVAERYDAARNYIRTGGYAGVAEPADVLIRRTGYFRSTLMHGERIVKPGFEQLNALPALHEAAHELYGPGVVAPAILYLNLLVPGQELAVHIDVPEFRGADRSITPQWLLVIMRASGLFEDLRVPITTGITYFGDAPGGALRYFPDGPDAGGRRFDPEHNSAMVLDTDSIYHGVERVGTPETPAPVEMVAGSHLHHDAGTGDGGRWVMTGPDGEELSSYDVDDVRISISWKAYWFPDDGARATFEADRGSLGVDEIERRLLDDLHERGLVAHDERPPLPDIVDLLIDTYQHFPDLQRGG